MVEEKKCVVIEKEKDTPRAEGAQRKGKEQRSERVERSEKEQRSEQFMFQEETELFVVVHKVEDLS
jgi:hypothetical protein